MLDFLKRCDVQNIRAEGPEKIERLEHKTYAAQPQVGEKIIS